jgi:hypothetical protein
MELIEKAPNFGDRDSMREKVVEKELKKPGYKSKIRAFCCHCIYDPYQQGSWLKQVEKCTSLHCPLYSVRPLPIGRTHKEAKNG